MPLISTSFPNLNGGVSQQPPSQRLENQCEAQENAIPQVIGGLSKRPPTEFVGELKKSGGAPIKLDEQDFIYFIQRDENEKYILGIETDGSIYLWDLNGDHQTLYTPTGSNTLAYLSDSAVQNPNETIRAVTIGDLTWIVNTTKKVQMKSTTSPASTADYEALLWIKNSGQGVRFKVDVKVGAAATQTVEVEYKAPEVSLTQGSGQSVLDPSIPSTADFAELLTNAVVSPGTPPDGFTVTGTPLNSMTNVTAQRVGSVIWISSPSDFQITVEDSFGQAAHELIKGAATSFEDLPGIAKNGQIVLVEGNPETDVDDYYVKFETNGGIDFGNGLWVETIGPGLKYELDPDTMPHILVRQPNGSWVVKPADGQQPPSGQYDPAMGTRYADYKFADRAAGSDLTNPLPSFVDSYISDITYFKGRLAITSGENVALSEAGEFFNFFRTTVTQLLDSAVIDIGVGGTAVNNLKRAVDFSDRLLLFSERAQFIVQGDPILTPLTATVTRATSFNAATSAAPVPAGSTLFFPFSRGQFSGVREFYKINENDLNFDAVESSLQVPKYIRGSIRKLTSSNHEDMLVVLAQPTNKLYCYKFFGGQQNRLQSAWFDMTIEGVQIVNAEFLQDSLFLVIRRGDRSYLERMDIQTGRVDDNSNYVTYLDYRTKILGNGGAAQAVLGDELVSNGEFETGIGGWTASANTVSSQILGWLRVELNWDPLLLFQNNEEGAWYDPSDSTTVFQDAAGTTPAGVGDPVGLILDKSKGLTLGSELVTTTDLAAQNANGTVSINGSSVVCTNTTSGLYGARFNPVPGASIGKNYAVTIAISTNSASKSILMDLGNYLSRPVTSSTGSASFVLSAISGLTLSIYIASGVAGESFTVSLVSVRELPGNHATQTTSAARPILQQSGATPVLSGTELVTNGTFDTDLSGWTTGSGTATWLSASNIELAGAVGVTGRIYQAKTFDAGKTYQIAITVLQASVASPARAEIIGGQSLSMTSPGSYVLYFTGSGSNQYVQLRTDNTGTGAIVRFADISVQEVTSWSGGLRYLDFDGVDDYLTTGTFAAGAQTQPNTIAIGTKNDLVSARYYVDAATGGTQAIYTNSSLVYGYAPNSAQFTTFDLNDHVYLFHFNGGTSYGRDNGVQDINRGVGTLAWDGVTLGSRGGGGFPYNGRIYSFVGVNRTLTAEEINNLESYLYSKSGVTP